MDNYSKEEALSYLPLKISDAIRKSAVLYGGRITEIRLRREKPVCLVCDNKNVVCRALCTHDDILYIIRSLCGNSLYCHSETIKEGYICTSGGIRAGVCGRAVMENGTIISVTDISSVVIRLPHRVPGASRELCRLITGDDFAGMIIFSPPGGGKTTALREICAEMSKLPQGKRVAVVDTRFEICGCLSGDYSIDTLGGYPRAKGMECAVRTLSPELIVCDEIGSLDDAEAIMKSVGSGVPTVVSAHASSFDELIMRDYMRTLISSGAFTYAVGLSGRTPEGVFIPDVHELREKAAVCL